MTPSLPGYNQYLLRSQPYGTTTHLLQLAQTVLQTSEGPSYKTHEMPDFPFVPVVELLRVEVAPAVVKPASFPYDVSQLELVVPDTVDASAVGVASFVPICLH